MISSLSELAAAGSSRVLLEHADHLASQPGTVRLDAFTHCLVAKCATEVIFYYIRQFFAGSLQKHDVIYRRPAMRGRPPHWELPSPPPPREGGFLVGHAYMLQVKIS